MKDALFARIALLILIFWLGGFTTAMVVAGFLGVGQ